MNHEELLEDLMLDHRKIEEVLSRLETDLDAPGAFQRESVEDSLHFLVTYADGVHHRKEEDVLFPALVQHGVPVENGPVGAMLAEHEQGRELLRRMRHALPLAMAGGEARESVRELGHRYAELLRAHIWKEDNVLFQIARRVLAGER